MEQIGHREYHQRRLGSSEHSCIIPNRWYETEYYNNMDSFIDTVKELDCDEIFKYIETQYGQSEFTWDYIKYFIRTSQKLKPQSIDNHKIQIMNMLKKRELNPLDYDGLNRLLNVLFPYLTDGEVTEVLEKIINTYFQHSKEGWASAEFGLMTDLENFTFALFSRFSIEDNIEALKEILKMHCMWLNGTETLEIEPLYKVGEGENIAGWDDFWNKLEEL